MRTFLIARKITWIFFKSTQRALGYVDIYFQRSACVGVTRLLTGVMYPKLQAKKNIQELNPASSFSFLFS